MAVVERWASSVSFVAQLYGDRGLLAFNCNVQEHLNIAPSIPCVEIVYMRKDVWLKLIDLHGHSGPRVRRGA